MRVVIHLIIILFISNMRGGSQPKPKLKILKILPQYLHRTQENSPRNLEDTQAFILQEPNKLLAAKKTVRKRFETTVRPIKSLRKQSLKNGDSIFPIFDFHAMKNSLQKIQKRKITEVSQDKRKKLNQNSYRIKTEKKNKQTEVSEHHLELPTSPRKSQKEQEKQRRISFKLNIQPPKNVHKKQKTQSIQEKNIVFFPESERIKLNSPKKNQSPRHRSIKKYQKKLSQFQKEEIENYEMFYVGPRRIYTRSDFTDSEGDPKVHLHDSIAYRYEIISQLGSGSFGKVYKAYDHKKRELVALKMIKCQKKFQEQAKVEVQILETALLQDPKNRSNVVRIKSSFVFREHTCISFQILHKNLYQFLKEHQFSGFSHDLIRRFAIQILQALKFFKKRSIIHCDLKPENILLKEENKSGIKVIDVGSGCFEKKQIYTYIQSRFYRAPEIILGIRYTTAIDMWSFGCILIELFTGFPIFPGESQNQQMLLFFQVLGYPPRDILKFAERRNKFFNDNFECKIPQEPDRPRIPGSASLQDIIGSNDPDFMELIRKCLEWDPRKRLTPLQALVHPWILKGLPEQIKVQHIQQMNDQSSF